MNNGSRVIWQSPPIICQRPAPTLIAVIKLVREFQRDCPVSENVPNIRFCNCSATVHTKSVVVYRIVYGRIATEELCPSCVDRTRIGVRAVESTSRRNIPAKRRVRGVLRHYREHLWQHRRRSCSDTLINAKQDY